MIIMDRLDKEGGIKTMEKREFNTVMNTIGKICEISAGEVEREIQLAIDSGFDNPDMKVREEWGKVPFEGERPTVQEVLEYLCKEMKENH